jgi:hypothetical protein
MSHEELVKAYKTFFAESPAGQHFMKSLDRLIAYAHESAESNPDRARDYTQHAKGVRNVKDHIASLSIEFKKGKK